MPPTKAKPRPTRRKTSQLNLRVTAQTLGILRGLCDRRAAEYAARGIDRDPARLQSEVMTELVYRAGAEAAEAAQLDKEGRR